MKFNRFFIIYLLNATRYARSTRNIFDMNALHSDSLASSFNFAIQFIIVIRRHYSIARAQIVDKCSFEWLRSMENVLTLNQISYFLRFFSGAMICSTSA